MLSALLCGIPPLDKLVNRQANQTGNRGAGVAGYRLQIPNLSLFEPNISAFHGASMPTYTREVKGTFVPQV